MSDTPISPAAGAVAATGYGSTQALIAFFITPAVVALALTGITNPLVLGTVFTPSAGAVTAAAGSAPSQQLVNTVPSGALSASGQSPLQKSSDGTLVGALALTGYKAMVGNSGIASTSGRLFVTEFAARSSAQSGDALAAYCPSLVDQTVAFSGAASVQSNAFSASTRLIRLQCDSPCLVKIGGSSPLVVGGNGMRISQYQGGEYFAVRPGDCLAVLAST